MPKKTTFWVGKLWRPALRPWLPSDFVERPTAVPGVVGLPPCDFWLASFLPQNMPSEHVYSRHPEHLNLCVWGRALPAGTCVPTGQVALGKTRVSLSPQRP